MRHQLIDRPETTSGPTTVAALLRHHLEQRPDELAYRFLSDTDGTSRSWTYRDLDRRARTIAARLQAENLRARPVLLLHPPGLDYVACFLGCLYAGAIAVPAYPPDVKRFGQSMPRLAAIALDCRATHALTTAAIAEFAHERRPRLAQLGLGELQWLAVDQIDPTAAEDWHDTPPSPGSLAFLQYTSGSTSTPKGVMVGNDNLISNLRSIHRRLEHDRDSAMVSWLPPYHDMGLIGGILSPLYGGFPAHLMAPATFVTRPLLWLSTLSDTRASTSVAPNFGFEQCVRRITPEQRGTLDLSAWRLALNGAEPVRPDTLERFSEYFAPCGFDHRALMPCYGLAESTLMVTGVEANLAPTVHRLDAAGLGNGHVEATGPGPDAAASRIVDNGIPVDDMLVAIVDPDTHRRCDRGRVGEIWLAGPSVARGYWRRPDLTDETFRARIDGEDRTYLRTGDLGFMIDGRLCVFGRIKDVVIIQGRNHYPQDVELTVENTAADLVRSGSGAAFGAQVRGTEQMVVAYEVDGRLKDPAALLAELRAAISVRHELAPHAIVLLKRSTIRKTTSGKIQRGASKQDFLSFGLSVVAASVLADESSRIDEDRTALPYLSGPDLRSQVTAAVSDVLSEACAGAQVAGRSFTDLGLDYARLIEVVDTLRRRFGLDIPIGDLLVDPRVDTLISVALDRMPRAATGRSDPDGVTDGDIERWLITAIAAHLGLPAGVIDPHRPFTALGLDSKNAVAIAQGLGRRLNRPLAPSVVFDHPTIRELAAALAAAPSLGPGGGAHRPATHEPIAIIGLGCRLPGAPDPESYWRLLLDARDAITEVPADRWDARRVDAPGHGGFLDHVDRFDAGFFGISAREADRMDPQQRILLEVAWQTFEDAGIAPTSLAGTDTGVFVGVSSHDYADLQMSHLETVNLHAATGNAHSITANRLSYLLDLRGPSMALDTACSSSLAAVHLACQALRSGECSVALAGGVNLMITPGLSVAFAEGRMLTPAGRCRSFDDAADGYVRGEGAGLVCLKPLSAALADGDRVYAVISGSGIGHGGRGNGLTAPRGSAQRTVIERALAEAGLSGDQIGYIEAHGTGTPLGDPIEWQALSEVYGRARENRQPCPVGSAKANIGHLEAAAGIAGLIKAALVVQRRQIPSQPHFHTPNRHLDFEHSGLTVPTSRLDLETAARRAAVSSFGIGGANVHLILEAAPAPAFEPAAVLPALPVNPLCLSGHTEDSLKALARRYRAHLAAHPDTTVAELCHAANTGRAHLAHRAVAVTADRDELDAALDTLARDESSGALVRGLVPTQTSPTVAFLFSGQGTQHSGMGKSLYETHPVFAGSLDRSAEILRPLLDVSLFDLLFDPARAADLGRTKYCQPALVAFEIALAELWRALGVRPAAVLGHSVGALAAAHVSGVLSLEDTLALTAARGRHMHAQPGDGAMIACVGEPDTILAVSADFASVALAAVNAPNHLVLSGAREEIAAVHEALQTRSITVKALAVSHAFHSKLMAGAATPLRDAARALRHQAPAITWISDATGRPIERVDAEYWVEHMLGTVRFAEAFDHARTLGCDAFIEIGPHPTLLSLGRANLRHTRSDALTTTAWLSSLRRDAEDWAVLQHSLAQLHCTGGTVDWAALNEGRAPARVPVPHAVLEPSRHWITAPQPAPAANQPPAQHQPIPAGGGREYRSAPAATRFGGSPEETARIVVEQVSQVCGFPADKIAVHSRLGADLGLDSLMKTDLERRLTAHFPRTEDQLRSALPQDPTVAQLISLLTAAPGSSGGIENPPVVPAPAPPPGTAVRRERRFEDWEEYAQLQSRLRQIAAGGANPYGRVHDGHNSGTAHIDGRSMMNFSAFNYLALSHHPRVIAAARAAVERYGTSCSATPLLCGETPLHHELDAQIASFLGTDGAIVFAGGHATNVATVGHMFGPQDVILHDEWIHDSSVRGSILSGARRLPFRHNDWQALDQMLAEIRDQHRRAVIVIEGAYSQDGDLPDLPRFIEVKKRHDAMLMIDEAHSIGVLGRTGRGVGEHFGVDRDDVDLWMGTLSKALGSLGGYIAAREPIIQYLKFTTPLFIFSTGISPANAAAALEALRVIEEEPDRVARVQHLAEHLRSAARARGLDIGVSRASAVIPVILGDWERTMAVSNTLLADGVNVMPIGYPAVPADKCRLRFFVNVDHTEADIDRSIELLGHAMDASTNDQPAHNRTTTPAAERTPGRTSSQPRPAPSRARDEECDVLVAGASGFIGGHLVRRLTDRGHRVRALIRAGSDQTGLADTSAQLHIGSLDDVESLRRATAGVRQVYNCTGKSADWGPWEQFQAVNIDGSRNLVEAAHHAGTVERFLHVSTTDVYGYPSTPCDESTAPKDIGLPYNRSKVLGEQAVREAADHAGLPLTIVRPVSVYGPRSKDFVIEIATLLLKKQMVYISKGQVPAGLLYVTNAADAMIAACDSEAAVGRAYNLRDPEQTTWRAYIEALAAGLGVKPPTMNLPSPVATGVATASEALYGVLRIKSRPVLTRHAVRLLDRDQSYAIDRACADFGFKSEVGFEEGMRRTLAWLDSAEGHRYVAR
ncbi:MAG TPA: aminotransferase class I/II-fold pyridoxal phosphate-dependent enzyme [Actinospica sp.]|nr:aminotransferase class I/II-fold pyridoxal phosphate-dependent enzyme [Actinospica sp.]